MPVLIFPILAVLAMILIVGILQMQLSIWLTVIIIALLIALLVFCFWRTNKTNRRRYVIATFVILFLALLLVIFRDQIAEVWSSMISPIGPGSMPKEIN